MLQPDPQRLRIGGHELAYHRRGQGDPVLLVHGITTYSFIWRGLFEALAAHHDVIAVDLLGCGDSDTPLDVSYSLAAHAERLEAFTQALDFGPFSIIGHDLGGGIAQRFAAKFPSHLTRVALLNSVAFDYWPVQPILTMRTPIVRQLAMAALDLGALSLIVKRGLFHPERLTPELLAEFQRPLRTPAGRKAFLHFAECLDNRDLTELTADLNRTQLPFLILRGREDVYLSAEIAHRLHRELPGSRLVELPEAGHFLQVDQPARVLAELEAFLGA